MVKLYEDVEAALILHKTQYSFIVGDFNAKGWKKSEEMTAIGNFGIDTQNGRGDMLVGFSKEKFLDNKHILLS